MQTASPSDERWLPLMRAETDAALRLFCFPHAGGAASAFRQWQSAMPPGVQVGAVQLPGRETRIGERPIVRLEALVAELATTLGRWLTTPYALAGHSMGALIAFELARELRRRGMPGPVHLFVSARGAPQTFTPPARFTFDLDDAAFAAEVQRLDGTPAEVLEHPELRALMLPLLRADFEICETYTYVADAPLACGITAFGGRGDAEAPPAAVLEWAAQTTVAFSTQFFPGGHFFFREQDAVIRSTVAQTLGAVATA